jgi:hypothetical protein
MDAGLDYGGMFIVQDQLCEGTRWHVRTVPANPELDPYFPLNQAAVTLAAEQGKVALKLRTMTPNLQALEVRVAGGSWAVTDASPLWNVGPGRNRLEVRTVNRFGVYGPTSTVEVVQ